MFKKLLCVLMFFFLIYVCAAEEILFYGESVTVATNYSSGSFYTADKYFLFDATNSSGVSKEYDFDFDYEELINRYNAEPIKVETVGNVTNFYYYTKNLPGAVFVGGKKVNLHVAVSTNKTVIGSPIIYYGF